MFTVRARCTCGPRHPFVPTTVSRRAPGPRDVLIDIAYAGICHSDIDHAWSLRGTPRYPLVPGHEIAGVVAAVGAEVTKFAVGDHAGVGNMVDACRACPSCLAGLEQYCSGGRVMTYNSTGRDGEATYGGYSEKIVVDQDFALRIPASLSLAGAAPLLCAGITLYSPLKHWRAGPGKHVAIVGFGGLGHMGVQIARAMGARVTVFDLSPAKREDALRLGATEFRAAGAADAFAGLAGAFDLIVSTVPARLDLGAYLELLAVDGTLVNLAPTTEPLAVPTMALLRNRRSVAGSLSGGIAETQEMLDFCARHDIAAEVEVIAADRIDEAFARLIAGDVRYRFVIDIRTLATT